MKALLKNSLILFIPLFIIACNNSKTTYHEYQSIAGAKWKKGDTIKYKIPPTDSLNTVKLYAEVRNTLQYQYADLYLVVKQNIADSLKWQTDTIRVQLADNTGKWTGKGWGNYYQTTCFIKTIKLPPHPFQSTVRVSQGMKDDILNGISDIGLRIDNY